MFKKSTYRLIAFLFLTICSLPSFAQQAEAFARVSVSPREGIVRQAYKVNISVHSSTWFTSPLQFSNLHIDDAFLIPFTRTVSSVNYINKKKYATLTFYYLVFPYSEGDLEIPEITMSTNIPPEGGYKGEPRTIKTQPQKIKVKPIPYNKDEKVWMVAKSASISEKWSKSTSNLKVGDVIERSITINANGTLPSLISPLDIEEPESVSIYPKAPVLKDKRNDEDVNGQRIESYSYLFEEAGELSISAVEVSWFNPNNQKTYKRIIPEQLITILPNPDLDLVLSIKDSLNAINAGPVGEIKSQAFPWKKWTILILLAIMSIYILFRKVPKIIKGLQNRRASYLESDAYYFNQIKKAIAKKDLQAYIRSLYSWFDKQEKTHSSISVYLNQKDQKLWNKANATSPEVSNWAGLKGLAYNLKQNINPSHKANKEERLNP